MATATLSPFVAWLGENFWSKLDDADLQAIQEAYMRGHGVDALAAKIEAGLRELGKYFGPMVPAGISYAMSRAAPATATTPAQAENVLAPTLRAWANAYPRMDLDTQPGTLVMFDGCGGSEQEKKFALQVLNMRELYEVESMNVGDCSSTVKLKGIVHEWNTVMFAKAPGNTVDEPGPTMPEGPRADGEVHADGYWTSPARKQGRAHEAKFGPFLLKTTASEWATQAYKAGLVAGMQRVGETPALRSVTTTTRVGNLEHTETNAIHADNQANVPHELRQIANDMARQVLRAEDAIDRMRSIAQSCAKLSNMPTAAEDRIDDILKVYADYRAATSGATAPYPDLIRRMVDRFLGWRLPKTFAPDGYIKFDRELMQRQQAPSWPIGTNLLTAEQAREMFEYVLGEGPQVDASDGWSVFDGSARRGFDVRPGDRWPRCPVTPELKIRVRLRDGTESDCENPELLRWAWNLRENASSDIVAYKIIGGAS